MFRFSVGFKKCVYVCVCVCVCVFGERDDSGGTVVCYSGGLNLRFSISWIAGVFVERAFR